MMMKYISTKTVLTFFIITLGAFALQAQHAGRAGAFSRLGFGPRGMAMGNALTAVTQEGIYGYYNPALVAHAKQGNQVDLSTAAMSFDRSLHTLSSTFQLPPSAGASISVINANVNNIDGRTSDGYHTNMLSTHEYQFAAAAGISISKKISVGIGVKYYLSDLHNELDNATTVGLDLGFLYILSDQLQLGGTVKDLLASYNWDSTPLWGDNGSSHSDPFPTQLRVGVSYQPITKLLVSFDSGQEFYEKESTTFLRLGSTYHLHQYITIRGGWQIENLSSLKTSNHGSAGFSIYLPFDFMTPTIDYAFLQESNNISYMHTFGIQLNL
ncbi:hypothetical protein [Fodinibius halophilus]|uniref:PorV/PorQ family protein n=1 Tax=Fodinibius halophilus TaxID=1736908 RepID=A0A6M1SZA9_9BACT|nr:hypothetical protein [Fodinibius halophilus]NGP86969.1 hypothetical protein [Fodinibius halophilus]